MPKENNKVDINKHEKDIDTLFKQNVNDLLSIKELYRKLKEMENKISQIKYIDSNLANKLKKEYENLKKIILDEYVQTKLVNDIETINVKLNNDIATINAKLANDIETINSQLDTIANKGTTVEVLERVTKEEIERQIQDGTLTNLTIADGSITQDKLSPDLEFGINNLTDEAKMSLMGDDNEEIQITHRYTSFENFTKGFLVVQQKLQPCIIKNIGNFKCKVLILNSIGLNAEILQIHELDTGIDTNITVAKGGYIAIMRVGSNGEIDRIPYGNRDDDKPKTDLHYIEDYSNLIVGGTVNTVKMSSLYTILEVKIEPLTIPSLKQDVIDVKKEITSNKIEAFTQLNRVISQVPSENLQTVYKQDFTSINDTWAFVNCTNLSNGGIKLTDYSKVHYSIYQAFDEWKLRAKIKIKDVNSIFGFTSVDGEWESGSIMFDGADNVIKWSDKEITSTSIPESTTTDNSDLTLDLENTYLVELQRSGLFMKFSIYDIKNAKKISFEKTHKRFHGSLAFVTTNGDVDLLELELKVALYSSCKNMFVGDSITEGLAMGTTDISKRWASLLRDNYFKGNAICCGRGWGTSANALDIINCVYKYGYRFNFVTVMIGTNERSDSGLTKWKNNIVKIYDTIKANGSIPIIVTPPLGKDGITYIQQMRDFIQEKGWDTIRMDLATSVNNDGNTFNSSLSTDGTHFNESGNQAMYERALFDLEMIM